MSDVKIGAYARSKAGHDAGKIYVINYIDKEYVFLVDGRIRTIDNPKRKKVKHIEVLRRSDLELVRKINLQTVKDEEIKRSLKLLQNGNSSKEDK